MAEEASEPPLDLATLPGIGPYRVLERLGQDESGDLLLAYDPKLRREVWIRELRPGAPELSPERRELRRPTRLRWLAGKRSAEQAWDAFEAPTGRPLARSHGSWREVRVWLADLVEETSAGGEDRTLPATVDLDRVWITGAGRAKLLDFAAPGADAPVAGPGRFSPADFPSVQRMLCRVAGLGLTRESSSAAPPPLAATSLLADLGSGSVSDPASLRDRLKILLDAEPEVTRRQRIQHLRLLSLPAVASLSFGVIVLGGTTIEGRDLSLADIMFFVAAPLFFLTVQSVVSLPLVFLFRGGLLFRLNGIDVVTTEGEHASRLRCLLRAAAAWSWVWALAAVAFVTAPVVLAILWALCLAGVVCVVWRLRRSLQDRLAGTFLVPGSGLPRQRRRKERIQIAAVKVARPRLSKVVGLVGVGLLVVVGLVFATNDLSPPRLEDRNLLHELPPYAGGAHGKLYLEVAAGRLVVEPGQAGEPLRVEATYDAKSFELDETWTRPEGSVWEHRVVLRRKGRRRLAVLFGDAPELRVALPKGVPIGIDGTLNGSTAQLDLGDLWIPTAKLNFSDGGFSLDFSEPLEHPMKSLVVDGLAGGWRIDSLGNASPEEVRVDFGGGGGTIDLGGRWSRGSDIRIACLQAGITLLPPEDATFRGRMDSDRRLAVGAQALDTPSGELRVVNASRYCTIGLLEATSRN